MKKFETPSDNDKEKTMKFQIQYLLSSSADENFI